MKIQNKIAILFTALSATIKLLFSIFVYYFASRSTYQNFYHRLEVRARIVANASLEKNAAHTHIYHRVKEEELQNLPFEKDYFIKLDPRTGQVVGKPDLPLPEHFYRQAIEQGTARYQRHGVLYGAYYPGAGSDFLVVANARDVYGSEELAELRKVLIIGFLASILLVYSTGRFFSWQVFRPIRDIVHKVKKISANNLHLRLNAGKGKDELSELALTFNDMLTRLETAFETQNNFISNASHELRTPLTVIAGEAELALAKSGPNGDHAASFTLILHETERLKHLVTSLLSLAQTGFDGQKQQWEKIRIDELIWAVKTTVDQIYPGNKVMIDYSNLPEDADNLSTEGSLPLLKLALSNIVLNACKYSDNQPVTVQLSASRRIVSVTISDQGIGIPEEELHQIFVPFFRASNTGQYEGYGIGLPLARNIILLHKGFIDVQTRESRGTTVKISLPVAS